jgi:hypothetical protein
MKTVRITERAIPPLRPGDYFHASGDVALDALDLAAIHELFDAERLAADLLKFCHPVCRSWRELAGHLLDAHPDADDGQVNMFLSDCGRAILANIELHTDH